LFHHDHRDYNEAASDAAKKARQRLEAQIEAGRQKALAVIDKVIDETPRDKIVRVGAIEFDVKERPDRILATYERGQNGPRSQADGDLVINAAENGWERLHRNALGQMAERANMPMAYVNHLENQGKWGKKLLADNLRELFMHKESTEKYLLRSVHNEVRGFLSNRFRRLDTKQLLETATGAFRDLGMVPVDGIGTDTRVRIRALLPVVFEPVPNEIVAYGVTWGNSDYGNGAHVLQLFCLRLWCTNYASLESVLREIHLGARLDENTTWSDRTYKLDTERSVSMLDDALKSSLSPDKVNAMNALIVKADEEKVSPVQVNDYLKRNLTKGLAEQVKDAFASADIENLPPGQNKWRLSNALSWIAGKVEDKEQALDLQQLAGRVLENVKQAA
jgi:hypothetical protein